MAGGAHCELFYQHLNLLKKSCSRRAPVSPNLIHFTLLLSAVVPTTCLDHRLINIIICVPKTCHFSSIFTKPSVSQQSPQQQPLDCDNFTVIFRPLPAGEGQHPSLELHFAIFNFDLSFTAIIFLNVLKKFQNLTFITTQCSPDHV